MALMVGFGSRTMGGKIYEGGVLLKWRCVRTEAHGDGIASVYKGSIERPYLVACKAVLG